VEAFAGSLGGEQMLTEVEPASAALRSASAFFASGLLPLSAGDSASPELVMRFVAEHPVATCYVVLYPDPIQT
jgi:hypothetical protein